MNVVTMVSKRKKSKKSNGNNNIKDPMAVAWTERFNDQISRVWTKLPIRGTQIATTVAVMIFGISINGEWLNILVHAGKQFGYFAPPKVSKKYTEWSLESIGLKDFWSFLIPSLIVSYALYFVIGGFLTWYYYIRQRDTPEQWKCQPKKWLTPELERHEILFGSATLFVNAATSAVVSCYIANGGYSTVYYEFLEYGLIWFILQWPVIFISQDYVTYWLHRMYHTPFLYKKFHKLHHKYKQPTVFSVTAIHPIESLHIQFTAMIPLFVIPVHWLSFYTIALYIFYHGIIDHSGINIKAQWWQPWQPDAIFHDNHHQYFHVNFGFNIFIWDKWHGTYRQKDRVYTEEIFYGKGKKIDEVSAEELKADLAERNSENPLAYRNNKLEFQLSKKEVEKLRGSTRK